MSMMSWFPTVSASYTRPTGSYVDGLWVPATATPTTISIIEPQRDPGEEGQYPVEGDRVYTHLKTWTSARLRVNDVLSYGGIDYRVVKLGSWYGQAGFGEVFIREIQP